MGQQVGVDSQGLGLDRRDDPEILAQGDRGAGLAVLGFANDLGDEHVNKLHQDSIMPIGQSGTFV
ncbi:MAG: hypothetical protein GX456_16655 [Verrucomicrobia bacterium]|nr:hypothetical protein [Verrucomicrobiota bacterium]